MIKELYLVLSKCLKYRYDGRIWSSLILRYVLVLQSGCLPMYSQLWDEWAPTSERSELLAFTLSGKPTVSLKIKLNL